MGVEAESRDIPARSVSFPLKGAGIIQAQAEYTETVLQGED